LSLLPLPPVLEARAVVDGYRIVRELHASHRSHIYLAVDIETDAAVVLKAPAVDLHAEPALLERFLLEEWIARRIQSPHVLKPRPPERERSCLYLVTEFIDGQTLAQWMIDHARPEVETVRGIVEQIARGLQAFHRLEMLHQDLRPENVLIDATGTVKIIDFGAVRVAGIVDGAASDRGHEIPGTAQYTAPEYFLGEEGTQRADLFSLAVLTYQMLGGRLPYGLEVAKTRSLAAQKKLDYAPLREIRPELPAWIDEAIRKAVQPEPGQRQGDVDEFVHDLHHPSPEFLYQRRPALIERHPVVFWKAVSLLLFVALVGVLGLQAGMR
jgi:serine/threonine protein kinase